MEILCSETSPLYPIIRNAPPDSLHRFVAVETQTTFATRHRPICRHFCHLSPDQIGAHMATPSLLQPAFTCCCMALELLVMRWLLSTPRVNPLL